MAQVRTEYEQNRLDKISRLIELGVEPYGRAFPGTRSAAEVAALCTPEPSTEVVRVAGRLMALRGHGKAGFLDLHDRSGKIQLYVRKDNLSERDRAVYELLDLGDIIGVAGNPGRTRTGEPTIFLTELTILSKAVTPPPEKWHGLADVEARYRQRYVDLFANPEVRNLFMVRSRIIALMRQHFNQAGYVEVETPMMHHIPGGAAAKPFVTHHNTLDMDLFLRVAPELHLKRLLVGGMEAVYEIGRCFRNEGISVRHNPEFTQVEIYRAFGDYNTMMQLTEDTVQAVLNGLGRPAQIEFADLSINLAGPWRRAPYLDLFAEKTGLDPADTDAIRKRAYDLHVEVGGKGLVELRNDVFEAVVEETLVDPTFVVDYPVELCPLAKTHADRPGIAERFELYIGCMEVANGYSELNDPAEQARRFVEQLADSRHEWASLDEDYVRALEYGMPPAGGLGIGIDRLVMLLTGSRNIRDVLLFPLMRPEDARPEEG